MSSAWKCSHFGKPPKLKKVSASFLKFAFTETEQLWVKKDRPQKRYTLVLVAILVDSIWQKNSYQSPERLVKTVSLIHLTQEKFKWTVPLPPTSSVAFFLCWWFYCHFCKFFLFILLDEKLKFAFPYNSCLKFSIAYLVLVAVWDWTRC